MPSEDLRHSPRVASLTDLGYRRGDVRVQQLLDVGLAERAHAAVHYLAALEHQQRGDPANLVLGRRLAIVVNIQLALRDVVPQGGGAGTRLGAEQSRCDV